MTPAELRHERRLSAYSNGNLDDYIQLKYAGPAAFEIASCQYWEKTTRPITWQLAKDLHHKLHTLQLSNHTAFDDAYNQTVFKVFGKSCPTSGVQEGYLLTIAVDFGFGLTSKQFYEKGEQQLKELINMSVPLLYAFLKTTTRIRVESS
jgi:hypothetical protein